MSSMSSSAYKQDTTRTNQNNQKLKDGIVGLKNNSLYCYLNSCIQCLLPIEAMRDHFLSQQYAEYKSIQTMRNDFSFCNNLYIVYKNVFR